MKNLRRTIALLLFVCAALTVQVQAAFAEGNVSQLGQPADWTTTFGNGYTVNSFLGDATGDGKADAISALGGTFYVSPSTGTSFGAYSQWSTTSTDTRTYVGDVNADGKVDAIVGSTSGANWSVALSSGTGFGAWTTTAVGFNVANSAWAVGVGDINGDGRADLVTNQYQFGNLRVSRSSGTSFGSAQTVSSPASATWGQTSNSYVGDVNGDGKADLVSSSTGTTWTVWLSTSTSTVNSFAAPVTYTGPSCASGARCFVANVDGTTGVEFIAQSGANWNYSNAASSTVKTWPKGFTPTSSSATTFVFVGDASGDGAVDAVSSNDGTWKVQRFASIPDQVKASGSGWASTFSDEFSTLNTNSWNTQRYDYWLTGAAKGTPVSAIYNNNEGSSSIYTPANNTINTAGTGSLVQKIIRQTNGTFTVGSVNSLGRINTNGSYVTNTGFRFKKGYVEARIKVPACEGCWPAFWMLPAPPNTTPATTWAWPGKFPEELDIFEFFPNVPGNIAQYNTHWGTWSASDPNNFSQVYDLDHPQTGPALQRWVSTADLSNAFHTYGFLWTDTYIQFFVDGVAGQKITQGIPQQQMYIISTMQHAHAYPNMTGTFQMETDYIKIWQ